jgi:hypothetical protein
MFTITTVCAVALLTTLPSAPACGQAPRAAGASAAKTVQPGSRAAMRAVAAGLKFLQASRDETGRWTSTYDKRFPGGVDSLVIATSLSLGVKGDDAQLAAAIAAATAAKPTTVYARAMRLMAYVRLGSDKFGAQIAEDAEFLQARQSTTGGWGYGLGHPTMHRRPKWTDMCNTTFALLALSDAASSGATIKPDVWKKAAVYLSKVQNPDGGWGYEPAGGSGLRLRGTSHGSMTAAGVTAMSAVKAKLPSDNPDLAKYAETLAKGRKWLGDNYALAKIPKWGWGDITYFPYFYLYMLSRVAVESGSAQIGQHSWQGELLGHLIARQSADGAWRRTGEEAGPKDIVYTCFALMALSNAQKPVLVNKLIPAAAEPDGADVAALAGWLGQSAKRDARWQFVPHTASQSVLDAAPVLYIAPPADMTISDSLAARIRLYVLRGGMVLVAVPQGDTGKTKEAFLSVFEQYYHHAALLTGSHPAFSIRHKITSLGTMTVTSIGDYCRSRVFLISGGFSEALQKGSAGGSPAGFQLAANLAAYSGIGFTREAPRRPAHLPKALPASKNRIVTIARIRHAGDWYTGPAAIRYLHNTLAGALSLGVSQTVVDLEDPITSPAPPLLWMTGTKPPKLSTIQQEMLGAYLKKGGMIFVDSALGKPEFAQQAAAVIGRTVGVVAPEKVTLTDPLITGKFAGGVGSDLTKATVRIGARQAPLAEMLSVIRYEGRVVALISRCAVTVPLDGGYTYGCVAPSADDARRLAANAVLFALTQRKGR